jgi:hydroxymethylpyrimidine/phosphomethylpyrimidine kinase
VKGRVLIIAGSDSGGGAGIQADIKTVSAFGGYAATAITALTAQNSLGVHAIHPVPAAFVQQQIKVVLDDLGADALKTGMLGDAALIEAVADSIAGMASTIPLVVDPVMVAKGGAALLAPAAIETIRQRLIPLAALVTPNLPEAEALTGLKITSRADIANAASAIRALGVQAVLIKGGHGPGDVIEDWLFHDEGAQCFANPRIDSRHTHGTGCTLASAIAVSLAQGMTLAAALERAISYVRAAIRHAPGYGNGHGPLNHGVTPALWLPAD